MIYASAKFDLPKQPRCPVCQRDISGESWMVWQDFVWCPDCVQPHLDEARMSVLHFHQHPRRPHVFHLRHGLNFYAPDAMTPRTGNAAFIHDPVIADALRITPPEARPFTRRPEANFIRGEDLLPKD